MLARIICWFKGHKRGKFQYGGIVVEGMRLKTYQWTRRVKAGQP